MIPVIPVIPVIETTSSARALTRFSLNSPDARRLVQFYVQAFGAQVTTHRRHESSFSVLGPSTPSTPGTSVIPATPATPATTGGTEHTLLRLGEATLEVVQFDHPGRPYPHDLAPYDTRFQHLAIVVTDMQRAVERLAQTDGWSAISTGGPQTLPDESGGVTAFKFRDPDGHPLEFLQFAAARIPAHWRAMPGGANCQGIDHSAVSVADVQRSVLFYESLGLHQATRTLNQGAAQERLDGVAAPTVDVIGLEPPRATPHVELLRYHTSVRPRHDAPAANDVAATRLVFTVGGGTAGGARRLIQDPDGHFLQFE